MPPAGIVQIPPAAVAQHQQWIKEREDKKAQLAKQAGTEIPLSPALSSAASAAKPASSPVISAPPMLRVCATTSSGAGESVAQQMAKGIAEAKVAQSLLGSMSVRDQVAKAAMEVEKRHGNLLKKAKPSCAPNIKNLGSARSRSRSRRRPA